MLSKEGQNAPFPTPEERAGGDDKREMSWGRIGRRVSERTEKGPVFGGVVKNGKDEKHGRVHWSPTPILMEAEAFEGAAARGLIGNIFHSVHYMPLLSLFFSFGSNILSISLLAFWPDN